MFQKTTNTALLKIIFWFVLLIPFAGHSQELERNPYGLQIVGNLKEYRASCVKDKNNELVDLSVAIPGIQLDVRYATENNFTHKVVYTLPKAYLRLPAAKALGKVQEMLRPYGVGLKVYDAYRPYAATLSFWDIVKDTLYVANPQKGSRHNRGCAVDLTLIDLKTGAELEMPTGFDDFTPRASSTYIPKSLEALKNRQMLIDAMYTGGFKVYASEWWHYDFAGWDKYSLMDIPFEELQVGRKN